MVVGGPVSQKAAVLDAGYLLGFYAMHGFGERFYWIRRTVHGHVCPPGPDSAAFAETDWLVVFHEADGILHLHDVLAMRMPSLRQALSALPHDGIHTVSFDFTPDRFCPDETVGTLETALRINEDAFFIKSRIGFATPPFLHPLLGWA